ncbi:MAG: hypothetical protein PHD10_05065 [Bacilli bacterium]|nr:hypothetical protein [Bacilli bacterium]
MEKLLKILNQLDGSLINKYSNYNVKNLIMRDVLSFDIEPEYYSYTINEIISFYKIKLLVERKIVTEEVGDKLTDLYIQYIDINRDILDESYHHTRSTKVASLYERSFELEAILNTFHIIDKGILENSSLSSIEYLESETNSDIYNTLYHQEEKDIEKAVYTLKRRFNK